jgi:hypothetical protein
LVERKSHTLQFSPTRTTRSKEIGQNITNTNHTQASQKKEAKPQQPHTHPLLSIPQKTLLYCSIIKTHQEIFAQWPIHLLLFGQLDGASGGRAWYGTNTDVVEIIEAKNRPKT